MIDLYKLNYFRTVARLGSFVRAAEELRITQPALSRSVQSLEQQFGVQLMERGRNGVVLTATGKAIVHLADDLLYNADRLEQVLLGEATGERGDVAFGIGPLLASVLVPRVSVALLERFPEVRISVTTESVDEMMKMLLDGDVEFFLGAVRHHERVSVEVAGETRPRLLARPGHPLLSQDSVALPDLARFPILAVTAWFESVMQQVPAEDHRYLTPSIQMDNYAILRGIARESDGILIAGYDRLSGLSEVRVHSEPLSQMSTAIGIHTLSNRPPSPAAHTVLALFRSAMASMFRPEAAGPE